MNSTETGQQREGRRYASFWPSCGERLQLHKEKVSIQKAPQWLNNDCQQHHQHRFYGNLSNSVFH